MIPKGVIDAVKKFREENKTPPPSATLTTKARGQSNPTLDAIKDAGMRALQGVSTTLDAIPPSVDLYPGPVDNVAVMGLAGLNKGIKTLVKGERGMDEVVGAVNAVRALKPLEKVDDLMRGKTVKLPTQPTYYRATTDGQTLGSGQKWAWTDKASAESWAKRNNAKVVEFTVPDSAIDPIDLSRMKQGTTDRFMFDTSKANTLPKLPIQTGKPFEATLYRGSGKGGGLQVARPEAGNALGEGTYYANVAQASRYGGNITEHKVSLKNPLYITTDQDLRNISNRTSLYAKDPLEQKKIIEEVRKKIIASGHDGVVVKMGNYQDTQYLQKLFGHNQVIDYKPSLPTQTGERVYHGTNYDKFDPTKAVSRDGQYGKGIYFASDKAVAKQYGKNTIEAVLDKDSLLKMDKPLTPQQQANLRKVMGRDEWDWSKNPTGDFVWGRLELSHKNPEEILKKAGIKGVEHSQYTTKGANKNYVIFDDSAVKPSLPTQVEGLAKEASKYKSAEEFVKGQGKPLYHGTNEIFETFDANKARALGERGDNLWGAGFYTSPGSKTAKNYGENLMELYGKPKKTLDLSKFKTTKQLGEHLNISEDALMMRNGIPTAKGSQAQQLSSHAKELGYDSIFTPVGEGEMVILDPSLVKTKSQLTDIFNQSKGVQNAVQAVRAVKK